MEKRPIPGFVGYEVDTTGQVWSNRPGRWGHRTEPLLRKQYTDREGYRHVGLLREGKVVRVAVHRAVASAFHGLAPRWHVAAHLNGNPADNRPANLRWVTQAENIAHKVAHGTEQSGDRSRLAKVTEADAREMLALVQEGIPQTEIARQFGVSRSYITGLKRGRFRRTLTAPPPD